MKLFNKITLFFCLLVSYSLHSQENFQKIYLFEDTFAIFNDIYITDSCYYYTCTSGKSFQREFFNFGKIHLDGTEEVLLLDQDVTSLQRVMFSQVDMDTNFRGNFVTYFVNSSSLGSVPRIKELNFEGDLVNDFVYNELWQIDSLEFRPATRQIIENEDSTYYLLTFALDYTTDDNSGSPGFNGTQGCILFKIKFDGTILFTKKFNYLPIGTYKPTWVGYNFLPYTQSSYLIVIDEQKIHAPASYNLNWARTHFIEIDKDGNELNHQIFQDGQYSPADYGCTVLSDGGVLFSYYESYLDNSAGPNNDYFRPRPVLARLDTNFDMVWKQSIRELYGTEYSYKSNMHDFKLVNDSLFVGAFNHVEELVFNQAYRTTMRLSQYNLDGINKWHRDYTYFLTDDFNDPSYGIYDLELTNDGGYILCGEIYHYDSLNAGAPGQFGYILKTNCLGFLGEPEAAFSFQTSENQLVQFTNTSIQAGSYTWNFGDGTTLQTDEYEMNVEHTYQTSGDYEVMLFAHGCNGSADTLTYLLNIPEIPTDTLPTVVGDGTLLTIFPNPIIEGESLSIYIGAISDTTAHLEIVDYTGKVVFLLNSLAANTTYIFPVNFASGVYIASLRKDKKVLEVERLQVN